MKYENEKAKIPKGSRKVIAALSRTQKLLESEEKTKNFHHREKEKLVFKNKLKRKKEKQKKEMQRQERLRKKNRLLEPSAFDEDCQKFKLPKKNNRLEAAKSLTTENREESSKEEFGVGGSFYPNYKKAIAAVYRKSEKEKEKAAAKKVLKEEAKNALWEEKDKHICNKIQRK
ncbi:hypothetical protein Anas_12897, partial [Armadillidium nasatum]